NVARTEEEAERQASGEDVTAEQQAETGEITPDVEEIFDEGVEVELSDDAAEGAEGEAGDEIAAEAASEVSAEAETEESVAGTDGDEAAEDETPA
ncbi:MAG: hypothetical protein VYC90_01755, partial [Pseudomonadota bacterium]|nr:hypothetical protein [Pseudomonadota bacterium]